MRRLAWILVAIAAMTIAGPARAETTECNEITALPATLTAQGVYCMKADLITSMTSGNAITVANHSITLDMNGFKLGGAGAGPTSLAIGIFVANMKNFTLRNGSIRGFYRGLEIVDAGQSTGHLIEDVSFDGNLYRGMYVDGTNYVVRRNSVINMISTVNHVTGMYLSGDSAIISDNMVSNLTGIQANSASPIAIRTTQLSNTIFERNLISKISSNTGGVGILLSGSNIVAKDNKILELMHSSMAAISILAGNQITLVENVLVNSELTAIRGVWVQSTSTNVLCIRNIVDGFTNALVDCSLLQDNITP